MRPDDYAIPLPAAFVDWVVMACEDGLSCPVGRALYICNRKKHTWPTFVRYDTTRATEHNPHGRYHVHPTERELMRNVRASVAEKWLAHWLNGGSVEGLKWTDLHTLQYRQQRADKDLSEGQRLRRAMRRARRGTLIVLHDNDDDVGASC